MVRTGGYLIYNVEISGQISRKVKIHFGDSGGLNLLCYS